MDKLNTTFIITYSPTPGGYIAEIEALCWADGAPMSTKVSLQRHRKEDESTEACLMNLMGAVAGIVVEFNSVARDQESQQAFGISGNGGYALN
jgi:hypothetical protein